MRTTIIAVTIWVAIFVGTLVLLYHTALGWENALSMVCK